MKFFFAFIFLAFSLGISAQRNINDTSHKENFAYYNDTNYILNKVSQSLAKQNKINELFFKNLYDNHGMLIWEQFVVRYNQNDTLVSIPFLKDKMVRSILHVKINDSVKLYLHCGSCYDSYPRDTLMKVNYSAERYVLALLYFNHKIRNDKMYKIKDNTIFSTYASENICKTNCLRLLHIIPDSSIMVKGFLNIRMSVESFVCSKKYYPPGRCNKSAECKQENKINFGVLDCFFIPPKAVMYN